MDILNKYLNEAYKQPELLKDLMDIHLLLSNPKSFVRIKGHTENLDTSSRHYKELKRITTLLLKVLEGFSK